MGRENTWFATNAGNQILIDICIFIDIYLLIYSFMEMNNYIQYIFVYTCVVGDSHEFCWWWSWFNPSPLDLQGHGCQYKNLASASPGFCLARNHEWNNGRDDLLCIATIGTKAINPGNNHSMIIIRNVKCHPTTSISFSPVSAKDYLTGGNPPVHCIAIPRIRWYAYLFVACSSIAGRYFSLLIDWRWIAFILSLFCPQFIPIINLIG